MGWIKIDRSIKDHWLWSDDRKLKWWLTILLEVNYSDRQMSLGYKTHNVKRGQSSNSIRTWANIFKTGTKSVVRFLDMLERDGLITKDVIGNGKHSTTLITVCKYDSYDHIGNVKETQENTQGSTQVDTQEDTQEGDKRRKEERKKERKKNNNIPTIGEFIGFFIDNRYSEELARKAYTYYSENTGDGQKLWRDGKGNVVRDWKSKVRNTWFKNNARVSDNVPDVPNGYKFLSMSEAHDLIRNLAPVSYSESKDKEMYVRKEMARNRFYSEHKEGWKYKK